MTQTENEGASGPVVDVAAMTFNELRKLAADRGVPTTGTKEELIERLSGGQEAAATTAAPAPAGKKAPMGDKDVERLYVSDAMKMKKRLDAQPKVMVFIPFEQGENPLQAAKIKFVVNINGYQLDIPRGVATTVPQQVAEMIQERLESEGRAGRQNRVDLDPARQEALSG